MKQIAPWFEYYYEMVALFGEDPEIILEYDERANIIRMYVENNEKAIALAQILPSKKTFGNVSVAISIIPANTVKDSKAAIFEKAFKGNPVFSSVVVREALGGTMEFVLFKKMVAQYYTDSINDAHGVTSTLYQDIARNIFANTEGVFFCTDIQ